MLCRTRPLRTRLRVGRAVSVLIELKTGGLLSLHHCDTEGVFLPFWVALSLFFVSSPNFQHLAVLGQPISLNARSSDIGWDVASRTRRPYEEINAFICKRIKVKKKPHTFFDTFVFLLHS